MPNRVRQASSYRLVTAVMGPTFAEDIQAAAVMGPSFAEGVQAAPTFATSTASASASFAFVVVTTGWPFLPHPYKQLARGFIEGHCCKDSNCMEYFAIVKV